MSDIIKELPLDNVITWSEQDKLTLAYKIQQRISLGYKILAVVPLEYKGRVVETMISRDFTKNELVKALIIFEE